MQQLTDEFRDQLLLCLRKKIEAACPDYLSFSSVGSFQTATDVSCLSDVDCIVIIPQLDVYVFRKIKEAVCSLDTCDLGLPGWKLKINDTFGPLKFNEPWQIVIHLMIYDLGGHKKHVEESPFTCLDWELGRTVAGYSLRELYPAGPVTLQDVVKNRRGLETYLRDVMKGVITFRRYAFDAAGQAIQVKEKKIIDERHKCEYAYHIVKFSALNLYKVLHQKNICLQEREFEYFLEEIENEKNAAAEDVLFFHELHCWKREHGPIPEGIHARLIKFLARMADYTAELEKTMPVISFIRHAETPFNDGSFLGQRRDPDIMPQKDINGFRDYDSIWCGTLKRTIETAELFAGGKRAKIRQDCRLNEIDYGEAEGEKLADLKKRWPEIFSAWTELKDPRFPDGENSMDVQQRLSEFIQEKLAGASGHTLVVTHNVLLRLLICNMLQVPLFHSWKFRIPHLKSVDIQLFEKRLIPSFSGELRKQFREQIAVSVSRSSMDTPSCYGILWQPSAPTCRFLAHIKDKIFAAEPEAPYCTHPVHCTFFVMTARESFEPQIKMLLADYVLRMEGFQVEYQVPTVFEHDVCTGGDTLIWPIVLNKSIFKLQLDIANLLERFRSISIYDNENNKFKGVYSFSLLKYGYPFVGSHWLPHVTAASVKTDRGKKIIADFLELGALPAPEILDSVSLFKINGNEHQLIQKFTFGDK